MNREWIGLILLVLFCAYLCLFGLERIALTDPDETFYAETAREMINHNEWLTPHIFGKPQFEKPPLYYWLVIFSFKTFGINEFSARIVSAIFGILGIVGVYLLGKLLINKRTALFASVVLATSIEYLVLSRACVTDMVLGVLILYTFLFFFCGHLSEFGKTKWYLLSAILLGLSVLTKGPIGVILSVIIIGVYLSLTKELKRLKEIPLFRCTLLFLGISLPWYLLMYKTHGKEFIDVFFGFHNIIRFLEPEHTRGDVFYYYIPIMIGGFFPWSIFLPYSIFTIIKKDKEKLRNHTFLFVWILTFFIFFSIARSKLPTYIFPLFPALAIIVGRFCELKLSNKYSDIGTRLSGILYLISLPLGFVILYKIILHKYPDMNHTVFKSGIILLPFLIISFILFVKKKMLLFFSSIVLTIAVSLIPLTLFLSPFINLYESSKFVSQYLKDIAKPNEQIGAETGYRQGVTFYLDREDVIDAHPHHILITLLQSKERVWCVMKDKNHQQLYTINLEPFWLPTYVVYKFGKKVIITNKIPEDGKYLKRRSIEEPI